MANFILGQRIERRAYLSHCAVKLVLPHLSSLAGSNAFLLDSVSCFTDLTSNGSLKCLTNGDISRRLLSQADDQLLLERVRKRRLAVAVEDTFDRAQRLKIQLLPSPVTVKVAPKCTRQAGQDLSPESI